VLIAGSEEAIQRTCAYTTWRGYVQGGRVPGDVMAPFFLAWWRRVGKRVAAASASQTLWAPDRAEVTPAMVPEWNAAAHDLFKVLSQLPPDDPARVAALAALKAGAAKADAAPTRRRRRASPGAPDGP
jgi:hypothetical protein